MDRGRLIAVDTPENLKRTSEKRSGRLLAIHARDFRQAFDVIRPSFPDAFLYGDRVHLRSKKPDLDREKLQGVLAGCGFADAVITEPSLSMDEAFIDFIRYAEAVHA